MLAATSLPTFRVRSIRGVLSMAELVEFAAFAETLLAKSITVEGFDSARPSEDGFVVTARDALDATQQPRSVTLRRAARAAYRFPRSGGLAFWPQLRDYHRHIWPRVREMKVRGNIVKATSSAPSAPEQLRLKNA